MPKNKKGGKKFKRGKKRREDTFDKKNVELAEEDQEYAKVLSRVGGSRIEVECTDGKVRSAIIPGKMKRRVWMNPGDILLVNIGGTGNDNTCYIDKKYWPKEVAVLRQKGLINFEEDDDDKLNCEFKSIDERAQAQNQIAPQNFRGLDFNSDSDDEAWAHVINGNKKSTKEEESDSDSEINIDDL